MDCNRSSLVQCFSNRLRCTQDGMSQKMWQNLTFNYTSELTLCHKHTSAPSKDYKAHKLLTSLMLLFLSIRMSTYIAASRHLQRQSEESTVDWLLTFISVLIHLNHKCGHPIASCGVAHRVRRVQHWRSPISVPQMRQHWSTMNIMSITHQLDLTVTAAFTKQIFASVRIAKLWTSLPPTWLMKTLICRTDQQLSAS